MDMSNNLTLDALYQKYQIAREQADSTYDEMELAHKERQEARDERNRKYTYMIQHSDQYYTIWNRFHHFYYCNKSRIESLQYEAKYASEARRMAIDDEIADLEYEIMEARIEAKRRTSRASQTAFYRADYAFKKAKTRHEIAKTKYEKAEQFCEQCQTDYEHAKKAHEAHTNQPPN